MAASTISTPQEGRLKEALLDLIFRWRWVFVILCLFPLSVLYDLFLYVRSWTFGGGETSKKQHTRQVECIQKKVVEYKLSGSTRPLCTSRPAWMSMSLRLNVYKQHMHQIDVNLNRIVDVDYSSGLMIAEPGVTVGQITSFLLKKGYTLPVVPELDDLTVGGLLMGSGIESSSHKHGLFQDICESYEIVTADGRRLVASPAENTDVFHCLPWSYGTLGILVSATLRIIPCKPYIRLTYKICHSQEQVESAMTSLARKSNPPEFMEGIMFSPDTAVVMTGDFVEKGSGDTVNAIGRWYKPWFYKHVEGYLKEGREVTEIIPLRDYYHRHTKAIFWEMSDIIPFGNHPVFRFLFGWIYPIKISLLKMTTPRVLHEYYEKKFVCQDMFVPMNHLQNILKCYEENYNLFPLWLCPYRAPKYGSSGFLNPYKAGRQFQGELYVDVGAYGMTDVMDAGVATQRVENVVRNLKGFQMLYADCFMTREQFESMFDCTLYNSVRTQLGADGAFPHVYDKIRKYQN